MLGSFNFRILIRSAAILASGLFLCSCLEDQVAQKIITRPQVPIPASIQQAISTLNSIAEIPNYPISKMIVKVNSPPVPISLFFIQSGDYHLQLKSEFITKDPEKKSGEFVYNFNFSTVPEKLSGSVKGTVFLLHGYGERKESMLPWALALAGKGY